MISKQVLPDHERNDAGDLKDKIAKYHQALISLEKQYTELKKHSDTCEEAFSTVVRQNQQLYTDIFQFGKFISSTSFDSSGKYFVNEDGVNRQMNILELYKEFEKQKS